MTGVREADPRRRRRQRVDARRRLRRGGRPAAGEREMPRGVKVMDVGTGGLDLAYEVMRGYHALVLVDVSRQGGEPGTLYVMEPDLDEIAPAIEDGEAINPHGMDPATVLRFVRAVGGWPGKVVIVACEPGEVEDLGLGLSPALEAAVDRAIALVDETIAELRTEDGVQVLMHELSVASAVVDTALRHAEGRRVLVVNLRVGQLRQVVPDSLAFYFGTSCRARRSCEGARLEQVVVPVRMRCEACAHEWEPELHVPLPGVRGRGRGAGRRRAGGRFDRGRGGQANASRQGEGRRGRARRQQHDRVGQPRGLRPRGRDGAQPDERAGGGQDDAAREGAAAGSTGVRPGVLEGDVAGLAGRRPARRPAHPGHPAQHRPGLRRRVPPRRQHGPLRAAVARRWTTSTCWSSRTSATSSARPSSASARTRG